MRRRQHDGASMPRHASPECQATGDSAKFDSTLIGHFDARSFLRAAACYIDVPSLAKWIEKNTPYHVLSASEANSPIDDHSRAQLTDEERYHVNYWRPQTIGELIFNYWD